MNKGKFSSYNGKNFYGHEIGADIVSGLRAEVKHGVKQGRSYSYIVFHDTQGIKWKIFPSTFSRWDTPGSLRLHHRNKFGRKGFHSQRKLAWGTAAGLNELIDYITNHEEYERQ